MPNTSTRIGWSTRDEVAQQLQAGPVRPLQIIEHQHDRLRLRHHDQQPDHRREHLVPLGVSIRRRRRSQPWQPARQRRDQPGQLRSPRLDVGDELLLGGVGDEVAQRFGEQLVGSGDVLLAMPEQHTRAAVERDPGRLRDQRGLAETRFPRDQQHLPALTGGDPLERIQHRRQLGVSAHDTDRRAHGQPAGQRHDRPRLVRAERFPQHLDGLHRIGQALQGEPAQRTALGGGCGDPPSTARCRPPAPARSRSERTAAPPR